MPCHDLVRGAAGALVLGLIAAGNAAAGSPLTVYTALENEQLAPYKAAFEADNPGIEIRWVRDSAGIVTAKLLAEKDNPQADVVWGVAASNLMVLDNLHLLEGYAPKGIDGIKPGFKDTKTPPSWVGMDAFTAAVCFNTVEAARLGVGKPVSWADLVKPEYKGRVIMPNPASSGTGFLTISAWMQMWGTEKAWNYMDRLNDNIALYIHSGSKPCKMVAAGEYPVGISMEYTGAQMKTKGAPVDTVLPSEGIGWEMEATAIIKGTKNLDAARKLADWSASRKANELYLNYLGIAALPGIKQKLPNYPAEAEDAMYKNNDFTWAAMNRDSILAEWSKRYASKSEPKN